MEAEIINLKKTVTDAKLNLDRWKEIEKVGSSVNKNLDKNAKIGQSSLSSGDSISDLSLKEIDLASKEIETQRYTRYRVCQTNHWSSKIRYYFCLR